VTAFTFFQPGDFGTFQTIAQIPWVPALGMNYHLAADGVSLTMCLVTGLSAVSAVLFSWDVERRPNEFFFWLLLVVGGSYGVFLSADLFLFFVFYELVIVPKYFLIALWGSTNKEYGAMKLTLYSFLGGALVFIGILAAYVTAGRAGVAASLDLQQLSQFPFPPQLQTWAFPVLFLGFAVLAGIWPLHTWAPTGHVAAPTAASMLLAGVVMKLGAYGCLRVAMPLFPVGFVYWQPIIAWLAIIGIIYTGLVALVQTDFKFVIGYSSVSHMGFVLLGLAAANTTAVSGAVLQMFSHGVIAGLLFAVVGRMVYERTHTRQLADLRAMPLHRLIPFAALTFVLAGMASMGMPGFSGFPAELTILIGAWKTSHVWAVCAGVGVLVAAAFTLRVMQVSFFGTTDKSAGGGEADHVHAHPLPRITWAERAGAMLLIAASVYVGLKPDVLLNWIVPALNSPLMQAALKGGAP
jgi:NADH-quinone oxidoreductase subunit M